MSINNKSVTYRQQIVGKDSGLSRSHRKQLEWRPGAPVRGNHCNRLSPFEGIFVLRSAVDNSGANEWEAVPLYKY